MASGGVEETNEDKGGVWKKGVCEKTFDAG